MSFLRNGTLFLGFSALSLALAIGCSRADDADNTTASNDITGADGPLQDLVISQVYGAGSNANAKFQYDYVELFNQGKADVDLAGKTIQYGSAAGKFSKTKNILTLPATSPKLAANHYYLIQLAGPDPGKPLIGDPLTGALAADYVAGANPPATQSDDAGAPSDAGAPDDAGIAASDDAGDAGDAGAAAAPAAPGAPPTNPELISMSGTNGKVALVASRADALECGDANTPCDPTKYIDLVGYGTATTFRGAPADALSAGAAAIRRFDGCSHAQDNSVDFSAATPAPRNSKTAAPTIACDKVDASAPPPAAPDAGKTTTKTDGGKTTKTDGGKHATAGDDDDDGTPTAPDGDDDDDTDIPSTKKKPATTGASTAAPPPTFPATSPDCAMTPGGHTRNVGGLGAIFGIALAGAALRRRRR